MNIILGVGGQESGIHVKLVRAKLSQRQLNNSELQTISNSAQPLFMGSSALLLFVHNVKIYTPTLPGHWPFDPLGRYWSGSSCEAQTGR
ncbi:unnamed protein product [Protopolystoma xenopodis]|uniref:Uncharacterized protein n=1 Tax=Protopolystoma xenopodis TaxID=117903 RepID=A0A448WVU0_9PLAT|nr:unnamed protein product [Protopolystoma xenopodis]